MKKQIVSFLFLFTIASYSSGQELKIQDVQGKYHVTMETTDGQKLISPEEGLWSIATSWQQDWPADWQHASPTTKEEFGDWKILKGGS